MKQIRSFVGMDVHKATISISVAEDGRSGPVRFIGVIPNTPEAVHKMAKRLARHGELDFCYEASGCGYGIPSRADKAGSQVHRGRTVDDTAQARRADQD
jgi:transposase